MTTSSTAMFQPTNHVFGSLLRRWTERDSTLRGMIASSTIRDDSTAAVTPSGRPLVMPIGWNRVESIAQFDVDRIAGSESPRIVPSGLLIAC